MRWGSDFGYFRASRPRQAKGGIRAQSQRGAFAESWWAKRWISALEGFNIGARLGRGRSYARSGQVVSIDVAKGQIKAKVQGSRPSPYAVDIRVKPLSPADWKKVAASVASQALYASKLLGGEMPREMEDAFRASGVSLFPARLDDLNTNCSCPDWSNPCKHIAAVYYLLGEEFDRDPFLIFRMRGMNREEFLGMLGETRPARGPLQPPGEPEPLPADPLQFYQARPLPEDLTGEAFEGTACAALVKRLGKFPFWRGTVPLLESLEPVYREGSTKARDLLESGERTKGLS